MNNLHKSDKIEVLFYYINKESSFKSLEKHIDKVDIIVPIAYSVDEDGIVWGGVDSRVISLANTNQIKIMPIVYNTGFENEILTTFLDNKSARMRAIELLIDECKKNDYPGFQFDFENVNINNKSKYTQFCKETSEAFHAESILFSIAVVPRSDNLPGLTEYHKWLYKNWRSGYDYHELAEIADFISAMTYAQHTRRTPPGPNAGIPWIQKNLKFLLTEIPPKKLSLGIPVICQHWYTEHDDEKYFANARSWSKELKYSEAATLVEQFDAKVKWLDDQKVSFTYLENDGVFEFIFFEDARSFQHKLDLINKFELRGFSAWVIGYEDPKIWELIS